MKNKKIWIGIGIVLLVVAMIVFGIMRSKSNAEPIKTVTLKEKSFKQSVLTSGNLESEQQQNVYQQPTGGEIERVYVKAGEAVKKGDALVKFKAGGDLNIEQVKLEVERARVQRNQVSNQLEKFRKEKSKATDSPAPGAEQSVASEEDLRNQLYLANLEYKQSRERLAQAKNQLSNLTIRSEQDGTVIRVHTSQQAAEGSSPLITVANLKELKVMAEVSEYDAIKIKEEQKATLQSDALPDKKWSGQVTSIGYLPKEGGVPGEGSQQVMYPLEISLNEELPLKLGARIMAEVILSTEKVLTLPEKAVLKDGKESYVYLLKNKKAHKQIVKTGERQGEDIAITSGLKKEEIVISNPSSDLTDGMEVTQP